MPNIFPLLLTFLKNISVEPVLALASHAFHISTTAAGLGVYRVFCDKMFHSPNSNPNHPDRANVSCWDMGQALGAGLGGNGSEWWKEAEVELQQDAATYSALYMISFLLPSGLANIFLGTIGDDWGRKGVILLSIVGLAVGIFPFVILFSSPISMPIYIVYIFNAVAGLTGHFMGLTLFSTTYMVDVVKKREMISIRITILQMCGNLAGVTGPIIATALVNVSSFTLTVLISIAIDFVAFVLAMVLLKTIKPGKASVKNSNTIELEISNELSQFSAECKNPIYGGIETLPIRDHHGSKEENVIILEKSKSGFFGELKTIIKNGKSMLLETWRAVSKRRDGNKRIYLFISFYMAFVLAAIDLTLLSYTTLYLQKAPLSWTQTDVTFFTSASNLVRLIGSIGAIAFFKRCLGASDSLIMVIALISYTGQSVIFALASNSAMVYLSSIIGVFSGLALPCLQAFISTLLDPDELGKILGFGGVFTALSMVFGTTIIGIIYKATVATYAACVFVIGAGMTATALVLSIWLYLDTKDNLPCRVCWKRTSDQDREHTHF